MSAIFFKSNAEGSEIVRVPGEITGIEFEAMKPAVDGVVFAFEELAQAFGTLTFSFQTFDAMTNLIARLADRRHKLQRQHKVKGRGKNWRTVRFRS